MCANAAKATLQSIRARHAFGSNVESQMLNYIAGFYVVPIDYQI